MNHIFGVKASFSLKSFEKKNLLFNKENKKQLLIWLKQT